MTAYDPLTAAQDFTVGASLAGPNARCERCGRMLAPGNDTLELLDRVSASAVLAGMAGHWLGCGGRQDTTPDTDRSST
jgi:hypothetical protein